MRQRWATACGLVCTLLFLASSPAAAKVFLTVDEALDLAFPGCEVERRAVFLTDEQRSAAEELAGDEMRREGAVAPEDAAIDAVVARSVAEGGPDAVDVVCVLDLQMKYLVAIGAVGDEA